MESLGPVHTIVACSARVEIASDSITSFYEKLKKVSENLTTFSFPVASELDQLVGILKARFERAIREDRLNFRTLPLLEHHLRELPPLFEQSGIAPTDAFIELSKEIKDQEEVIFSVIARHIDYNAFPEAYVIITFRKIIDSIDPAIPFLNEAFLPELQEIYSAVEAFFLSIEEFEETERDILISSFQNLIYEREALIYEKIGKGKFPYSFDQWKQKILPDLRPEVAPPQNGAQFLILETYRILFSEIDPTDTHVYNSFRLLMFNLTNGAIPTSLAFAKRVSLLEGMASRIPKGSLFETRKITLIQNLVGELLNLHQFFRLTPSPELCLFADHLFLRLINAPIPLGRFYSSPEDYIAETLKDFAASKILLINRSKLESKALHALSEIPKAMKAFKDSLTHHLPAERALLYQTLQLIFLKNISLIYSKWLMEPLNLTIEEFKEKISAKLSSPEKKTTATTIALKTLIVGAIVHEKTL